MALARAPAAVAARRAAMATAARGGPRAGRPQRRSRGGGRSLRTPRGRVAHAAGARARRPDARARRASRPSDRAARGGQNTLRVQPRSTRAGALPDGVSVPAAVPPASAAPPARSSVTHTTRRTLAAPPPCASAHVRSCCSPAGDRGRPSAPAWARLRPPSGASPTSPPREPPTGRSPGASTSLPRPSKCTCAAPTANSTCPDATGLPPRCIADNREADGRDCSYRV